MRKIYTYISNFYKFLQVNASKHACNLSFKTSSYLIIWLFEKFYIGIFFSEKKILPSFSALLGSTRFNMAIIGFLGTAIFYTLRNDLSVSIVCMVNTTSTEKVSKSAMCPGENKTTETDTTNTVSKLQLYNEKFV